MLQTVLALLIAASGLLFVGVAAKRSCSRPKVRCALPAYDYQVAKYSPKLRAVSAVAIGIPAPVVAPTRLLGAGANPLVERVANEALQTLRRRGEAELQRIVSDEISNSQMQRLLSEAMTELSPEVDLQQFLTDANNMEIQRQLVETLQALKPGDAELQALLTDAGIRDQDVRNLLATAVDTVTSAEALSQPQPLAAGTAASEAFVGKTFQFVDSLILKIDHCSISKMSVQVYETGRWRVSLQADQNPLPGAVNTDIRDVTTLEPSQKFTAHLQRNQFFVRVFCYANDGRGVLGRSSLIPLEIAPFWVQQGLSLPHVVTGNSRQIRENFEQIVRAEIEFYYRTN